MKRYILILYFGLICCFSSFAQLFEGRVYDKATMEPIQGAYVYMNGTSIYTVTDSSGVFKLSLEKFINAHLIISHVSYEQIVIENPYEYIPNVIYLKEAYVSFEEVRVVADQFSRAEKLEAFKSQFLGLTRSGRDCIIGNEEDIIISYNNDEKELRAYSLRPLTIYNNYLGYKVEFNIVDFRISYKEGYSIVNKNVTQVYFLGYSSYIDMKPYDIMVKRRRDEIYEQSPRYFMKQLVNRALEEANFRIFSRYRRVKEDECFLITDKPPVVSVHLLPQIRSSTSRENINSMVYGNLKVLNKANESEIVFLTDRFLVDEYGNVDKIDKIVYFGYMGEQRFGGMLPLDYKYKK